MVEFQTLPLLYTLSTHTHTHNIYLCSERDHLNNEKYWKVMGAQSSQKKES